VSVTVPDPAAVVEAVSARSEEPAMPTHTYYKAVRPDGTDFRTGTVNYLAGGVIRHPGSAAMVPDEPSTYLSVSTEPAGTLFGGRWPCRLLTVEPVGDVLEDLAASLHKRAVLAVRVTGEVEAWRALGPNGRHVAAFIDRVAALTAGEATALAAAWNAAWDDAAWAAAAWDDAAWNAAAWSAALAAARDATRTAAWAAAGDAARDAARAAARSAAAWAAAALVVRDVLTPENYDTLTLPWRRAVGPIHPDDPPVPNATRHAPAAAAQERA
jgi:hypothetical protein